MSAPDADSGGGGLGAEGPRRRGVPSEGGEAAVGGGGVAGVPVGAGARRTTKPGLRRNDQPNLRLMAVIITIPLASLGVLLPFLRWLQHDPIAETPCVGVCAITPKMLSSAPPGCEPEAPHNLFIPHVPKTGGSTLEAVLKGRRHAKAWEMVRLREWRDAVPAGVVYLPINEIERTPKEEYERLYRTWLDRAVLASRPHPVVAFGHTFFHRFTTLLNPSSAVAFRGTPPVAPASAGDVRGVAMLRQPIVRLRSQYNFDRVRAHNPQYQAKVKEQGGDAPFEACAEDAKCRRVNEFPRWCSVQTGYLCGWGEECAPTADGAATRAMVDRAKANVDDLFAVIRLLEE
ncbi:hypothetical protein T484DRAFT_1890705, partial [Baffinella frigidus]